MKKRALSTSVLMAIALSVAVIIWMLSGLLSSDEGSTQTASRMQAETGNEAAPMQVSVRESRVEPVQRQTSISAHSEPNRTASVAAETDGRIVSISAQRGAPIQAGEEIAALDLQDREARVAEAEALVRQRELEYEAAQRLRGREFMSEGQIAEALAQLESARALLASIRLEIEQTRFTAPFDGILEERNVELGDFVGIGETVATVVDTDPLIVSGDVSEQQIQKLSMGSPGEAQLMGGEWLQGTVRYIAPVADPSTRTFKVELALDNSAGVFRAGMSARIRLPGDTVLAHHLSPALLALNDQGNLGVKAVGPDNRVQFYPVQVVVSNSEGIWVTGLPEQARVIAVGQGFVVEGEVVQPVDAGQAGLTETGGLQ